MVISREYLRQYRLLCAARDIKLVLQGDQLVARRQRFTPLFEVAQGSVYRDLKVLEIERLGDEIEGPPVHRRADILHVTVRRYDDGADIRIDLRYLFQKREAVHPRHVDVRDDHIDILMFVQHLESFDAVAGELEAVGAGSDLPSHALKYQWLKVRFVVDHENPIRSFIQVCPSCLA